LFCEGTKAKVLLLGSAGLESRDQVAKSPVNGGMKSGGDDRLVAATSRNIGAITAIFLVGLGSSER
jgi:hypothetical protein